MVKRSPARESHHLIASWMTLPRWTVNISAANHRYPSLRQLVEQGLGLFQVQRVKALGEPAVDRSEQIVGLLPFTLIALEPRHAHCGAEFPGFGLLRTHSGVAASEKLQL